MMAEIANARGDSVGERGRRTGVQTLTAALVLAGLVVGLPEGSSPAHATPDEPVRIMLVGDSMTQESSGDWTWRYRLWQHLTEHAVSFDLVGPRNDLWEYVEAHDGSQAYINPDFDRDHAARWGMPLALMDQDPPAGLGYTIGELINEFHPDVVVEMLGVNDLAFGNKTPAQLIGMLDDFVHQARAADPDVDIVLGQIPQPWRSDVATFNPMLDALADNLDTVHARVVSADTDADYSLVDSFDSAHPNARGELKIAAAFEDVLATLGVGPVADRPLPEVSLGPRIPPVLSATGGLRQVLLSWVRSPGSHQSEIWARDLTAGQDWHRVAEHATGTSATVSGLPGWHHVQLRTAPFKGDQIAVEDAWSNVVDVQVLDDHLDRAVATVNATAGGVVTVGWAPVPGATSYAVQWRRVDRPGGWLGALSVTGPAATVTGLVNRVGYAFRVRAERGALAGEWSGESVATVPALRAVTGARVTNSGRGLKARARPVAFATSYTLKAAPAPTCRRLPRERTFGVVAVGLATPVKRFRLSGRAVWVRWVAVRTGVEGELAPSATACVRLP
jgi:hypothetical protein